MLDRDVGLRLLPVHPVTRDFYVSRVGHPVDQTWLRRDFTRMLKLAGLGDTGLTPHSMRHSSATWHIARGRHASG